MKINHNEKFGLKNISFQSSRSIQIEREPKIKVFPPSKTILKPIGSDIMIECDINALPAPTIKIVRENGSTENNDRFKTTIKTMGDGVFKASLNIKNAQADDSDEYTCSAENTHGLVKESGIKVIISQPTNRTESLMQCCKNKNVKPECQGICTFNVDLDFLMFDPQCFTEFDKLMSCGSDGSDHR